MSPLLSHRKRCPCAPTWAGRVSPLNTGAFALSLCLLVCISPVHGAASIESPTPPPPPEVAPVISGVYPTDSNGNRIGDALEQRLQSTGELSIATAPQDRMVKVELVFSAPVTQEQIDDFLRLGGEITYIYRAISYGWNGRIPRENIDSLPAAMGPMLVLVEPVRKTRFYLDEASQTGRVRLVWRDGFAGQAVGFSGSPETTIGIIDTGVDETHVDLAGRCAYWNDLVEGQDYPVDYEGHGSLVAGVALGTGQGCGKDGEALRYTYAAGDSDWFHLVDPIYLPPIFVNWTSRAYLDGPPAWLDLARWSRGTVFDILQRIGGGKNGTGEVVYATYFKATGLEVYSSLLANWSEQLLENVVIVNTVSPYPGPDDGFNTFRGVAPGCKWAAVRLSTDEEAEFEGALSMAIDDLVSHRIDQHIKIINISAGLLDDDDMPMESLSLRDKVTSAVRNGVVVVAAAGNSAIMESQSARQMADPARAALAITVGASNDENVLTDYSTYGYDKPDRKAGEDFKPDLIAPGGSPYYTSIMSVDSGTCDGSPSVADKEPNDYANAMGTSFASPFVAGCAALVIEAMERQGIEWDFHSDFHPRYVKMLLCATASETNAGRNWGQFNPSLDRAAKGAYGFPAGKDRNEGYGMINADAALEAATMTYAAGSRVSAEFAGGARDRRVWARRVELLAGTEFEVVLENPAEADFDLYLYSLVPSETGTPTILASSTFVGTGDDESLYYTPDTDVEVLLVVKRVSGFGTFALSTSLPGPPLAEDVVLSAAPGAAVTIALMATDDGSPNPPGALTYRILSLPEHGQLESAATALPITTVPMVLEVGVDRVVYRPDPDWVGTDRFTYAANDGGAPPFGGQSNTATVKITIVREITVEYQVSSGADDAHGMKWSSSQMLDESALVVGQYTAGMRFSGMKVPQGVEIKSATLKICSYTSGLTGEIDGMIQAEAADNPKDFSGFGRAPSQAPKTDASQAWKMKSNEPWTSNTWYDSPDIRAVIQEIVDRPGWSADNAMVVIFSTSTYTGSDRKFWSYDGKPDNAARLTITYQPR